MTKRTPNQFEAHEMRATHTEADVEICVPPRVPSEALLGKRGELIIVHAGREYRLRRTSLGKLMLTA